jgi:hypothetical protein
MTAESNSRSAPWSSLQATGMGAALALPAGWLRWSLTSTYYGHEEEDWGNLEIVRGILDTKFQYIETEHMPLFTTLSAYASMLVGDAEVASETVAVIMGALTVALVTWIGIRWLSPAAGITAGLLVAVQPESVLYAASPLRESTYIAFLLLGIALVGGQRYGKSAVALSAAFLTRFNAAFTVLPALVLQAYWTRGQERRDREDQRAAARLSGDASAIAEVERRPGLKPTTGALVVAAALGGVTFLWAKYYHSSRGTWMFWAAVLERQKGEAVADLTGREHVVAVLEAVFGLLLQVLPTHVGWAVVPLALVGAAFVVRGQARDVENGRWLIANAATTLGLLVVTALVSTYPSDHNLYWKWLAPSVPFLVLLGAHGAVEGLRQLPLPDHLPRRPIVAVLAAGLIVGTGLGYRAEIERQITRSDSWYGTQIRFCDWIEEALPPDAGVLTTGIPKYYLSRRESRIRTVSWHAEDLPRGRQAAFGRWLLEQRVDVLIWMREDWTGAPEAAPHLARGRTTVDGPATLVPIAREDGYGFIAYRVDGHPGRDGPSRPPPRSAGGIR